MKLVVAAGVVLAVITALAPPVSGAPTATRRIAGADRYATAAATSAAAFPANAAAAYIATGEDYPDALAAGPVATRSGAPVLLTRHDVLPDATVSELRRLRPGHIVVLGGPAAVDDAVVAQLRLETPGTVSRRAGGDRYGTAAAVSAGAFPPGVASVYVATGRDFPDALAGGAAAAASGSPVLLTEKESIPAATADELRRLRPARILVLGGTAAISDQVTAALGSYASTVDRVAGIDRYATAVAVSTAAYPSGAHDAFVATGLAFPDATTGATLAGRRAGPLLLVPRDCMTAGTSDEIERLRATTMTVFGGVNAVGSGAEARATCR